MAAYARVGDPAGLRAQGLFVAEGRLVVRRLIEAPGVTIDSILLTAAALAGLEDVIEPAAKRCPVFVCSQQELNAFGGFDFHRGCLALARRPAPRPLSALTTSRLLLAMEGIGNPDNVGGIFRNALAFGAGGVVLDSRCADPLYRKAIRTSAGAVLRVPFTTVNRWPEALVSLKRAGYSIAALTPAADADPIGPVAASRGGAPIVLLLGSEGDGLSATALELADVRVRIPMDQAADSLNVAVAAGIALHRFAHVDGRSSRGSSG